MASLSGVSILGHPERLRIAGIHLQPVHLGEIGIRGDDGTYACLKDGRCV